MASISSIGIGSGLDASSIISQLVALETSRLTPLKSEASLIQTRLSTVSQLKSLASTLEDKLKTLSDATNWSSAMAVSSSNSAAITATPGSNAVAGNYAIEVTSTAQSQTITSGRFGGTQPFANGGKLTISPGVSGASAIPIDIPAGSNLSQVAAAINKANAGVSATILNDGTGQRLVLSSTQTGTAHQFSITGEGDMSALSYNTNDTSLVSSKTGEADSAGVFKAAVDAKAVVNGVAITSSSNIFDNVIQGLSFTAVAAGSSTLTVSTDTETLQKQVTEFVTAYNALNNLLTTSTKYEESSKTAGIFQGDSSIVNLQNALRRTFAESVSTSPVFQRLTDIGIDIKTGGTMSINETKLKEGLQKNASEMAKFFAEGSDGFADKMLSFAKSIQDTGSILDTKSDALSKASKRNTTEQDKVNDRATAVEARLRAQYTALDSKMASLNALSAYVSQQVSQWNKSSD